jgi:hypothetical protein
MGGTSQAGPGLAPWRPGAAAPQRRGAAAAAARAAKAGATAPVRHKLQSCTLQNLQIAPNRPFPRSRAPAICAAAPAAPRAAARAATIMSVITLQIGQCGNQLGASLFAALAGGGAPDAGGTGAAGGAPLPPGAFFRDAPPGAPKPWAARSVLIDMEPKVIDAAAGAARGGPGSWSYAGAGRLSRHSGSGNNWALGHNHFGPRVRDDALDLVRREVGRRALGIGPDCGGAACLWLAGGCRAQRAGALARRQGSSRRPRPKPPHPRPRPAPSSRRRTGWRASCCCSPSPVAPARGWAPTCQRRSPTSSGRGSWSTSACGGAAGVGGWVWMMRGGGAGQCRKCLFGAARGCERGPSQRSL